MRIFGLMLVLLSVWSATSAQASLTYNLDLVGDTSGVAPGSTIPVRLVLTEMGMNDGTQAHSLEAGSGLFGFGIRIDVTEGDATISNLETGAFGPAFSNASNLVVTPQALSLNMTSVAFFTSPFQGDATRQQTIANFDVTYRTRDSQLTIAGLPGGFPLSFGAGFSTTAAPESRVVFGELTVSAIPEPSSFAVLGLLGGLAVIRHRRRRVASESA